MYAQFFGNYLLSHGITKEQLMHAMQEANNEHPKLGTLPCMQAICQPVKWTA